MNESLINLRKELHQNPELSGHEAATAKRIVRELKKRKPSEILEGVGGSGVMATFSSKNNQAKKAILFRAELDAIAVEEETGKDYKSKNEGVMHGCGHDGHMAILIGLADFLKDYTDNEQDIFLLFQPAEETGEGATRILDDERFKKINIEHAFALHNLPGFKENTIQIKEGVFASASVGVDVKFTGRSSHAAYPEKGLNPSAYIIDFIQKTDEKLKSFKQMDPSNKAVNTYIRLGEPAFGISPGVGKTGFTLRSPSDESLNEAVQTVKKTVDSISKKFGGTIDIKTVEPFAATINSDDGVKVVKQAASDMGIEIEELNEPFPWSEDFGEFRKKCPITIFGLGAGENSPPLHSEKYDFNDKLIPAGIELFKEIIKQYSAG